MLYNQHLLLPAPAKVEVFIVLLTFITQLGGWWPSRDLTVCMACKTKGCKDGAPSSPPTKAIA
jgi:hypothetical protein